MTFKKFMLVYLNIEKPADWWPFVWLIGLPFGSVFILVVFLLAICLFDGLCRP
ncbi:hypothetical protein KW786_01855 [Candidatus Parcubacteria bacterium]|nr:hypothetical protein [Candidatus Parcubacteria bacterium]